ncbi:helix-turn-helix domain-containing protein [Allomesorhizobium alhagi]|uniref:AraC family transcriptional regulator n=1 Tax=Mesorhizobium alhagi CCNWXJ12-2 TaxID=1107882 RepID=H0HWT0_9HYPH|nr:AraC family transcriptional regulator [Mesorhizobium alhagi CCNWXJ12-2]
MPVSRAGVEARCAAISEYRKAISPWCYDHVPRDNFLGICVIDDCIDYIERNLRKKITLDDLANFCGRNKFQVIRTFRKSLGTTPHAFILGVRVSRAAELLRQGEPAAEVACEVGFVDQSHLIRYFKRHVGTTPRRFVYQA